MKKTAKVEPVGVREIVKRLARAKEWDAIDALRVEAKIAEDDVPANAFTIYDYAERYGMARKTASEQLALLAKGGKIKAGRKQAGSPARLTRFYWPA